jgi:hypothetical protein
MASPLPLGHRALDANDVALYARLALDGIHREYPNQIAHVLQGDSDARPPRELTPVFFGCYDWHSAVHGHWLLARLVRTFPSAAFADVARNALARSFTTPKVERELAYLQGEGRAPFERPYGLAWLLQLCAELGEWQDPDARTWSEILVPLEKLAAQRFLDWLPKLSHPIRTGEHAQTAFAFGLIVDWARVRQRADVEDLVHRRALDFYGADVGWSLAFEPGGQDFLSPGLAEADLLRRLLDRAAFGSWLVRFLPALVPDASDEILVPARVTDPTDGKLAHLDGLNLSRAWMLEGMAQGLPDADPRRPLVERLADRHRDAGLRAVTGEHYAGGHWLGTFAVYLETGRGLR